MAQDEDISRPSGYRARTLSEMECVRDAGLKPFLAGLSPIGVVTGRRSRREFADELNRLGLEGVLLPRTPGFRHRLGIAASRILSSLMIAAVARVFRPAVIHAENQHSTVVARGAAFLVPTKVIFDAHGALPEEVELIGQTRGFSAARTTLSVETSRALERRAWREADGVVAVSQALVDHFAATYGPRTGPIVRVPCAANRAAMPSPEARPRVRATYDLTDRDVVLYAGSIEPYQQPGEMVRLFSALLTQRPRAFLLIVSQSPAELWEQIARQNQLPSSACRIVSARGVDVPDLISAGDIGLMLRRDIVVNAVAFPTKLAEYLAAGVPVLATAATIDPARFILMHGVGVVAPSIAAADSALADSFLTEVQTNRQTWSDRCRAVAEEFLMWPGYAGTLVDLYDAVLRSNHDSRIDERTARTE